MIRSHESFQESHSKVVKPKTKWDIFKFPPFKLAVVDGDNDGFDGQ